jgi:chromosome segregation ATPase
MTQVKGRQEAAEVRMLKDQIRQLQSETTDLQDDLSSKETELAEGKRQVDRLKRQLAEAESQSKLRLHGMEEQLKLERERIQKTVQEKTLMEESLTEEMQKEADAYKRKLHDANTTIKQLESRSDEHAELRSLFEKEKSELQATVVSANKRRIAAEKECENLQNLVSGLTLQVEAANGEKTELSILVQRNADENASLNSKCASVMAEVDGLRSQIDALEAENRIVVEDLKAAKMLSAMNEGDVLRTKLKVLFSGAHVYA